MFDAPYFPINAAKDVALIGRQKLMDRAWHSLDKPTPDNLSIVGPRYIGKTVFLKSLAVRAKNDPNYKNVLYWELAYSSPQSDVEFIGEFCNHLIRALDSLNPLHQECREELSHSKTYDTLKEVMDFLHEHSQRVLVIFDGFDGPLNAGLLSGQLFGQIRNLFYGRTHRLITATRATNTELARNEAVESSPLWNILQQFKIGIFDDADINEAAMHARLEFTECGLLELKQATGCHPVLVLGLLNHLHQNGSKIDRNKIRKAAESARESLAAVLTKIWDDCSLEVQDCFWTIQKKGQVGTKELDKNLIQFLTNRGLAVQQSDFIRHSCNLIAEFAKDGQNNTGTISRLFGCWENYREEIRSVLELRLKQVHVVNNRLHKFVRRGLEDIPDSPDDCLNNLTSIEECALDLIWKFEFEGDTIPSEIAVVWSKGKPAKDEIAKKLVQSNLGKIPTDRIQQLYLLQRLTGSYSGFESLTKYVSKDTYVLLHAIHQFRNRSEHANGQKINLGVAVAALLLCIELLGCLARELGGDDLRGIN
jgi:hypothetical protein